MCTSKYTFRSFRDVLGLFWASLGCFRFIPGLFRASVVVLDLSRREFGRNLA